VDTLFERWGDKFTRNHIEARVSEYVRDEVDPSFETAFRLVDGLAGEYESWSSEQLVPFPLENIALAEERVVLGPYVLSQLTQQRVDEMLGALRQNPPSDPDRAAGFAAYIDLIGEMLTPLRDMTVLEVRVVAYPSRAVELAEAVAEPVIDLLRVTAGALHNDQLNVTVGRIGDVRRGMRALVAISSDFKRAAMRAEAYGAMQQLTLGEDELDWLASSGAIDIAEIAHRRAAERTGYEGSLLLALHWLANAQGQPQRQNALLAVMTSIETLLKGRNTTTKEIAEGVAYVVGTDLVERRWYRDRVIKAYRLRGAVAHAGHRSVSRNDLSLAWRVGLAVFLSLLRRRDEFSTQAELLAWIEDQRLS
jgi:hypothetical protein